MIGWPTVEVATALGQLGPAASEALPALLQASLDHEESVRVAVSQPNAVSSFSYKTSRSERVRIIKVGDTARNFRLKVSFLTSEALGALGFLGALAFLSSQSASGVDIKD